MEHFLGTWKLDKKKSEGLANILKVLKYKTIERKAILNTKLMIDVQYDHNDKIVTIKTITRFKDLLKVHFLDNESRVITDDNGTITHEKCYFTKDKDGICVETHYLEEKIHVTDKRTIKDGNIVQEIKAIVDGKETHVAKMVYHR